MAGWGPRPDSVRLRRRGDVQQAILGSERRRSRLQRWAACRGPFGRGGRTSAHTRVMGSQGSWQVMGSGRSCGQVLSFAFSGLGVWGQGSWGSVLSIAFSGRRQKARLDPGTLRILGSERRRSRRQRWAACRGPFGRGGRLAQGGEDGMDRRVVSHDGDDAMGMGSDLVFHPGMGLHPRAWGLVLSFAFSGRRQKARPDPRDLAGTRDLAGRRQKARPDPGTPRNPGTLC
jgi:hypothetical protein